MTGMAHDRGKRTLANVDSLTSSLFASLRLLAGAAPMACSWPSAGGARLAAGSSVSAIAPCACVRLPVLPRCGGPTSASARAQSGMHAGKGEEDQPLCGGRIQVQPCQGEIHLQRVAWDRVTGRDWLVEAGW